MPDDLHEWVSFEDPDEERTWVFDLTFLTSAWSCIYGNGCQGVLTGPAEFEFSGSFEPFTGTWQRDQDSTAQVLA